MVAGKSKADRYQYQLTERRQKKRQKRQMRSLKVYWQTALGATLLWGLWQLANAPLWYLYDYKQITIEGENLLPETNLKALIDLPFPQYVFQAEPHQIAQQLLSQAPLQAAEVNRQLFPARLVIKVTERIPIARGMYEGKNGYIDREGVWLPASSYPKQLTPPLLVLGFNDYVSQHWGEMYPILASSPVKIQGVNWTDANNLVLHTDLGVVHCGPYDRETLTSQLEKLDRMRELPKYLNGANVMYLDFRDVSTTTAKLPSPIP